MGQTEPQDTPHRAVGGTVADFLLRIRPRRRLHTGSARQITLLILWKGPKCNGMPNEFPGRANDVM